MNELNSYRVLIVEDNLVHKSDVMRMAVNRLENALKQRRIAVLRAYSFNDATPLAVTDMDLDCFLISSDMSPERSGDSHAVRLLRKINRHQKKVPVFMLCDRERLNEALSPEVLSFSSELIWIFEDSPDFIAGQIACISGGSSFCR